jgi:hypothetical protein
MKALASLALPTWLARLGTWRRRDESEPSGAIPVRDWIHVSTAAPTRLIGFDQGLVCVVMALLARERGRARGGAPRGEVVDVAIYESVFNLMEGIVPE